MHPELIELQALAAGILDPSRQRAVDEHLGSCAECARKYVEVFLGRAGGGKSGGARTGTPAAPATPVASPSVTPSAPAPAFAVSTPSPAGMTPVVADASRAPSPSPARVETIVTLRSGSQPVVEVQTLATPEPEDDRPAAPLPLAAPTPLDPPAVPARSPAMLLDAPQALDPRDFVPVLATPSAPVAAVAQAGPGAPTAPTVPQAPAPETIALATAEAQARAGRAALTEMMDVEPAMASAMSQLRSAGMTHIARSLTPVLSQPAVPATPAPAPSRAPAGASSAGMPRTWLVGAAAAALLLVGGGVIAYRGMVKAATEAAQAAAKAAAPAAPAPMVAAPVATQQVAAPTAADSARVAATTTPAPTGPTATTTSGGTVATVPAPTPAPAPARETRTARRETPAANDEPAPRRTNVALPSVNIPDVSGAVTDDAAVDRLNARSTSRAAASDLQRSAGWATSRTSKP